MKEWLKEKKLVADGAFGTYYMTLYGDVMGTGESHIPEMANITHPERVTEIHRQYIQAGAEIIRTNTFASNTISLDTDICGVLNNIDAAVKCARAAASETTFIVGDIGPIAMRDLQDTENVTEEYIKIGERFEDLGIDMILFETFPELETILPVIKHLKERKECTIFVHFSVNQFGYSNAGLSARKLIADAAVCQYIDGTGLNCGVGPGHMGGLLKKLKLPQEKIFSVLPNSGYPRLVQNRLTFSDNSEYFSEKMQEIALLGVDILGGCCGTTPDYIAAMKKKVDLTCNGKCAHEAAEDISVGKITTESFLNRQSGDLSRKLVAVELAPPFNADAQKLLDAAHILKGMNVDVVTFPDSPSGRTRADAVLMAEKVSRETGLYVMPHICCRDKNAIAIRSIILGAKINGINDFFIITGDPVPALFRQSTKSVFNFDAVGMMKIIEGMNDEEFQNSPVNYGGAINHNRINKDVEINRVKRKMAAGARFFMTQPVFSMEQAQLVKKIKDETKAVILVGIMPLVSRRNALFMKNEMAGINIPEDIIGRYEESMTREQGEAVGCAVAKEIIKMTEDFADGYYFSFPFNRVHMLKKILV